MYVKVYVNINKNINVYIYKGTTLEHSSEWGGEK